MRADRRGVFLARQVRFSGRDRLAGGRFQANVGAYQVNVIARRLCWELNRIEIAPRYLAHELEVLLLADRLSKNVRAAQHDPALALVVKLTDRVHHGGDVGRAVIGENAVHFVKDEQVPAVNGVQHILAQTTGGTDNVDMQGAGDVACQAEGIRHR